MILSQLLGGDLRALAQDLDIPVLAGLQHQGDVSVVPAAMVHDYVEPATYVPAEGVAVVQALSNGNTHLLLASGDVRYSPSDGWLTLGSLHVPPGAEAYLDHPEHGNSGIAPGRYVLRRKRELTGLVID